MSSKSNNQNSESKRLKRKRLEVQDKESNKAVGNKEDMNNNNPGRLKRRGERSGDKNSDISSKNRAVAQPRRINDPNGIYKKKIVEMYGKQYHYEVANIKTFILDSVQQEGEWENISSSNYKQERQKKYIAK